MVVQNNKKDNEMMLNINNDIFRIAKGLNNCDEFKRLLICTDYNTSTPKDLSVDLVDDLIVRTPLIPSIDKSVCAITINEAIPKDNSYYTQINIDIFTPLNQWIVKEGVRPLLLCHWVDNFMKSLVQTNGIRYRLYSMSNVALGDMLGYRLCYHTIIDK